MRFFLGKFSVAVLVAGAPSLAVAGDNCACPAMVPPSCEAPSCVAPSCVAPTYEGCVDRTCTSCTSKKSCSCDNGGRCCRPLINIDFSKHIVKKNGGSTGASFGSGFLGAAPPQHFVASSVPFLPLNVSTVPISLTGNGASAASSRDDFEEMLTRILERQNSRAAAAAAAAGDSDMSCKDPCGDIKQLQSDVREMKQITANLSLAVEQLVKERAAKQ